MAGRYGSGRMQGKTQKHFCTNCGRSLPQPGDEAASDETVIEPAQSR